MPAVGRGRHRIVYAMDHDETVPHGTVDYKTLFLGACALVLALSGGLIGYWNSTSTLDIGQVRAATVEQWKQIRDLDRTLLDLRARHDALRDITNDQEGRLRELERRISKLER